MYIAPPKKTERMMETKDIQRIAREGFDLWRGGKRVESMEKLCQVYTCLPGDMGEEGRRQLLQGIERYFRILLRAEAISTDELAEIEAVLESRLGCAHEKTVTLCRRIAELCVAPEEKQKWYKRAYENSTAAMLFGGYAGRRNLHSFHEHLRHPKVKLCRAIVFCFSTEKNLSACPRLNLTSNA